MTIGAACLPSLGALINHTCLWSLMLSCGLDPIFDAAQFSLTEVIRALVRKGYNLPSSSFCCHSALSVGLTSGVRFPSYLIIQLVNLAPLPILWWFGVSFVNFMLKRERHTLGCQVLLASVTDSDSVLTVLTLSWGWVTPSPHPPSPVCVGGHPPGTLVGAPVSTEMLPCPTQILSQNSRLLSAVCPGGFDFVVCCLFELVVWPPQGSLLGAVTLTGSPLPSGVELAKPTTASAVFHCKLHWLN